VEDCGLRGCVGAHKGEERKVDEQKSEMIDHHLLFDFHFSIGLVFCQEMLQFHVKLVKKLRSLFNKVKDRFDGHLERRGKIFSRNFLIILYWLIGRYLACV
jgi:hypothetical protein